MEKLEAREKEAALKKLIEKHNLKKLEQIETDLWVDREQRLGKGSYGEVMLGLHINKEGKQIPVAIKFLRPDKAREITLKEALKEAELLKPLSSDYIVKFYSSGKVKGKGAGEYFMALELMGESLFDFLKRHHLEDKPLLFNNARVMFMDILLGVKYLHDEGIIHRDLKLQNVLIDEHYNLKIADFGFAKRMETDDLMNKSVVGSWGYLPPEVKLVQDGYEGKPYDIYTLGIIFYLLVTGKKDAFIAVKPSSKDYSAQVKAHYEKGKLPFPDHIDQNVRTLIEQMRSENPKDRPTINEVLANEIFSSVYQTPIKVSMLGTPTNSQSSLTTSSTRKSSIILSGIAKKNEQDIYDVIKAHIKYKIRSALKAFVNTTLELLNELFWTTVGWSFSELAKKNNDYFEFVTLHKILCYFEIKKLSGVRIEAEKDCWLPVNEVSEFISEYRSEQSRIFDYCEKSISDFKKYEDDTYDELMDKYMKARDRILKDPNVPNQVLEKLSIPYVGKTYDKDTLCEQISKLRTRSYSLKVVFNTEMYDSLQISAITVKSEKKRLKERLKKELQDERHFIMDILQDKNLKAEDLKDEHLKDCIKIDVETV